MRKPDFFIVGAPRCGTTSMYAYLRQHPQIHVSVHKEPHFFGSDLTPLPGAVRDEALYLSLFAGAGDRPRAGESSVHYLSSRRAPFEIRDYAPAARIIVLLREPLAMAHSLYSLYTRTSNEDLATFEEALAAEPERRAGRRLPAGVYFPEGLQYTAEALHAEKVERWLEVFGREQVLCLLFDDFVRDTAAVYRKTLEFLGVDASFTAELDPRRAGELARVQAIRQLRQVPPEVRRRMQFDQMKVHQGPARPAPGAALAAELRERFSGDVARLGELLGRDLSAWTRGEPLPPVPPVAAPAGGRLSEVLGCVRMLRQIPAALRERQDRVETLERKFARWQRLRLPELPLEQRAYDPEWAAWFAGEAERIAAALAPRAARIEHFGSTAVPGLGSKNIIDIAVGVAGADAGGEEAAEIEAALAAAGYASFGNSPIDPVTRWLWRVEDDRAFVIHLCDRGRPWLDEQADLRDYLRACPEERERYAALKRQLAAESGASFLGYSVGKMALSLELVARALEWRASPTGRRT
ncbi:MAG TPA: GrpB family protein [Thermoanaerobaculia bacterium]|nr:GrpB family protein [Thermoanaerobaculia bacterium]